LTTKEFRLGLIGWPLKHSLSPVIHQAALKSLSLDGDYRCFPLEPTPEGEDELNQLLIQMRRGELQGLNVTLPHKESVIDKLDRLTMTADRIGAVNTIFMEGTELIGDNTDQDAFILDLQTQLAPETGNALVLGAGGAARAVVSGLNNRGWKVWVAARRISQAEKLAEALGRPGKLPISPLSLDSETLNGVSPEMSLIVNATSVGMSPDVDVSPWPGAIPFPEGACVYDLVYTPQHTQLVRKARASGLKAATGMGMLVEQAALAFERWTGLLAPREVMHVAGIQAVEELGEGS
jgi:shikimate dehydrogenase